MRKRTVLTAVPYMLLTLGILFAVPMENALSDTFTYRDKDGKVTKVEARLAGSGQGMHALELADGQYRLVPQAVVTKRVPSEPPTPLSPDQVLAQLEKQFNAPESFRGRADGHYVIGLVLSGALDKAARKRADSCLRKAARFMKSVERNFLIFTRRMKIPTEKPTHPLVLLIFETDSDFEAYHREVTRGQGLSAGNTAGFYSPVTNWLVIRMTECLTFETPLHEAIHQQVFNQHVLQRLAPTPAWFNEGIATGFEGNRDRISRGPSRVSLRYSQLASRARTVTWPILVRSDRAFRGDVFAGEAYTHAWSMHWLLATEHKKEYTRYVKMLGEKTPLQDQKATARTAEFKDAIGKSPTEFQKEFPGALQRALRKQKLPPPEQKEPGVISAQTNLADVTLVPVSGRSGELSFTGSIRNISAIRPMTFHILAITDSGRYAEWLIPNLGVNKELRLTRELPIKRIRGTRGGPSRSVSLKVSAAAPDSERAKDWEDGRLPVPTLRSDQR